MHSASNTKSSRTKILVVDDDLPAAMTLTWAMEREGYEVETCFDGSSAMAIADDFRPKVILLDIGMSEMDGLEVCRRIRAHPHLNDTAVYAQTGWADSGMRRQTLEAGFDQHVTKPINIDGLVAMIERA